MALLLAPYAVSDIVSKGRAYVENKPRDGRSEFARDRDRITHSDAFKRLQYKTQVFTDACQYYSVGKGIDYTDHLRNRLTHSLEVAQVARSIARQLNLNEDLVETLALAHDLGHAPFGHVGQDVLNDKMRTFGGFEHNVQSLKVVTKLESKYSDFPGLNLMFETREGLLKHCSHNNALLLGDVASRFFTGESPTLEAQVADLSDSIAYTCHDIEDGVKSGLITDEVLSESVLYSRLRDEIMMRKPELNEKFLLQEVLRDLMGLLIKHVILQTKKNIADREIMSLDEVRERGHDAVCLPDVLSTEFIQLKKLLLNRLYLHDTVMESHKEAEIVLNTLVDTYMQHPELMLGVDIEIFTDKQKLAEGVTDYISGMTDRFAYKAYNAALEFNANFRQSDNYVP